MLARKVLLCSLLFFAPYSALAAMDGPNDILKGIKAVSYITAVEKTVGGDGCKIDRNNLNTSLEFVANQSTNLKITHSRKIDELFSQAAVSSLSDAERAAAARMATAQYALSPILFMEIVPLQAQFACAGVIHAQLSAQVNGSAHIYGKDAVVSDPQIEIWTTSVGFVGPQQTFSNQTINVTEQIMKKLVNDWAASQ